MAKKYNMKQKIKIEFKGMNASGKTITMKQLEPVLRKIWRNVKISDCRRGMVWPDNHFIECKGLVLNLNKR